MDTKGELSFPTHKIPHIFYRVRCFAGKLMAHTGLCLRQLVRILIWSHAQLKQTVENQDILKYIAMSPGVMLRHEQAVSVFFESVEKEAVKYEQPFKDIEAHGRALKKTNNILKVLSMITKELAERIQEAVSYEHLPQQHDRDYLSAITHHVQQMEQFITEGLRILMEVDASIVIDIEWGNDDPSFDMYTDEQHAKRVCASRLQKLLKEPKLQVESIRPVPMCLRMRTTLWALVELVYQKTDPTGDIVLLDSPVTQLTIVQPSYQVLPTERLWLFCALKNSLLKADVSTTALAKKLPSLMGITPAGHPSGLLSKENDLEEMARARRLEDMERDRQEMKESGLLEILMSPMGDHVDNLPDAESDVEDDD